MNEISNTISTIRLFPSLHYLLYYIMFYIIYIL